jgi:REP element-mobilizing transposase RayT
MYLEGYPYFITTITYKREHYFEFPLLAELFISDLRYAESLKQFVLHGYSVLPDHVHLLLTPSPKANYSEIMRSLKTNYARDANDIIFGRNNYKTSAGDVAPRRLQTEKSPTSQNKTIPQTLINRNNIFRQRFIETYGNNCNMPFFKWQKTFRDHIIRNQEDFNHHLSYIYQNAVKHQLVDDAERWPWVWME